VKGNKLKKILVSALAITILSACSVVGNSVISEDNLQTKAADALGVNASQVSISDRKPDGISSVSFTANTGGRQYQCYITTAMGAVSSDAICKQGGKPVKSAKAKPGQKCNALLEAAGRC